LTLLRAARIDKYFCFIEWQKDGSGVVRGVFWALIFISKGNDRMALRINYLASALLIASFSPAVVFAHAHLVSQIPAADARVGAAPQTLTLRFSEDVEPSFSGVTLSGPQRQKIATETARVDPGDNRNLIVALQATPGVGEWRVDWHAVSVDGHKTHGSYRFHVEQ
jgi:methionine-rich copper-binding protein CopC